LGEAVLYDLLTVRLPKAAGDLLEIAIPDDLAPEAAVARMVDVFEELAVDARIDPIQRPVGVRGPAGLAWGDDRGQGGQAVRAPANVDAFVRFMSRTSLSWQIFITHNKMRQATPR